MTTSDKPRGKGLRAGSKLGPDLTVLGIIDRHHGATVCIVWHGRAWCPMACKVFPTHAEAEREAAMLRRLSHPNTVRFFGLEPPGILLMEFLEGPTLYQLMTATTKPQSISNTLRLAIHIGAALNHVHEQGFVHLDVTPSNIIVAPGGRPVLFDFGTARPIHGKRPPEPIGTIPYTSPEEAQLHNVTPAADVFGLAVLVYELIARQFPFPEPTRKRQYPQIDTAPTPLRTHRPGVPKGLDALLAQCLAADPTARPGLRELLPGLHRYITGGPPMWPEGFTPE
jgi:eukaryotic-like serine/threonine-protein kinase